MDGEMTIQEALEAKRKPPVEKEVNLPPEYDYAMVEKFGDAYMTADGRKRPHNGPKPQKGRNPLTSGLTR